MLHIVNKSPFESSALASCLARVRAGAAVLLIEDAVYGAAAGAAHAAAPALGKLAGAAGDGAAVYALGPDLAARGLAEDGLMKGVRVVDYEGFVELVAKHDGVQSWL